MDEVGDVGIHGGIHRRRLISKQVGLVRQQIAHGRQVRDPDRVDLPRRVPAHALAMHLLLQALLVHVEHHGALLMGHAIQEVEKHLLVHLPVPLVLVTSLDDHPVEVLLHHPAEREFEHGRHGD